MNWKYTSTLVNHDIRKKLKLSVSEYCVIDIYQKTNGLVSMQQISKWICLSIGGISKIVESLGRRGVVKRTFLSDKEAMSLIDNGHLHGCISCGPMERIHKHHYPIRKKDGGKLTVPLCDDCHLLFHTLSDYGVIEPLITISEQ